MGIHIIRLPDIGEGVTEAEIVGWHVKPGDVVAEDQTLVDVMTDKATVDLSSPVDGTILAVHGKVGDNVPVGAVLIEVEVEGAGNADESSPAFSDTVQPPVLPRQEPAPSPAPTPPTLPVEQKKPAAAAPSRTGVLPAGAGGQGVLASPATRRKAHELGIHLQYVPATGPGGRITAEDLKHYIAHGASTTGGDARYAARMDITDEPVIGLRRKIAEKMQEAKRRIPHIAYVEELDVTQLEALRADMNAHREEGQPKLTLLPFLMRALVRVLPQFPQINARYDDDGGVLHKYAAVHIGMATQTPGGLMVPVVRHAESLNVWEIAAELSRLAQAARDGSARREELSGSTITITSLGPLGGLVSTPVINHPEVAIIGPNNIVERPVIDGSFIARRKMMNLSSSFDHRIVDGYDAALFVQQLKRMIEHPALIFMD